MCGRYRLARKKEILAETFDVDNDVEWSPRYNVAPGQDVPVVRQDAARPARSISLARWGLMYPVFEGGGRGGGVGEYLSEPIARRMMADSPELRKQFEEKLAADPQFAADRTARLQWWFERSPYQPSDSGRYPIVRVWEKDW